MRQSPSFIPLIFALGLSACTSRTSPAAQTPDSVQSSPASESGSQEPESLRALHVEGDQLMDDQNNPVVLQGYSTFGIAWKPEFVNESCFQFLKDEIGSQVIRLAMYTADSQGYCTGGNQEQLKELIDKGVQAAQAAGQYVIIDWHILSDGNPAQHQQQAVEFFREMSARYAGNPAVIYEICNEPNGADVTWASVKSYAETAIQAIRRNDSEALILVGTPQWCQQETEAAADLLENAGNAMYTVHFYAATHKDQQRKDLETARKAELPMFVSEFGITEASGNGTLDTQSGREWISLLNQDGISRIAWAISDKEESSSIFKPGTNPEHPSLSDLTEWGQWLRWAYTGKDTIASGQKQKSDNEVEEPRNSSAETASQSGENGLEAVLTPGNTWQSEGLTFTQFGLAVTNTTDQPVSGWALSFPFTGEAAIDQSWNGSITVNDNTVTIKPAPYHTRIEPGQTVSDIGFITKSDGPVKPQ